jgi:hypothetical protein
LKKELKKEKKMDETNDHTSYKMRWKKWGYCDRLFSVILIFRNLAKFRTHKKKGCKQITDQQLSLGTDKCADTSTHTASFLS